MAVHVLSLGAFCACRSPVYLAGPVLEALAEWPYLVPLPVRVRLPSVIIGSSGPFGRGSFKLLELLMVALVAPQALHFGPLPKLWMCGCVLLLSAVVAVVLHLHSTIMQTRGEHSGLASLAAETSSQDRRERLGWRLHLYLAVLGLANGIAEEAVSRGISCVCVRARTRVCVCMCVPVPPSCDQ